VDPRPLPNFIEHLANSLHWRTRPETIRRELLFTEGDPCDPRRLAESERLLRAQTYIRSARVTSTGAQGGGVDIAVETRDDWSLRSAARIESGGAVKRFRLSEESVLGRGIRVQVGYNNLGRSPGFEVGVLDHQFLGRHDAELVAGRSSAGPVAEQSILRPFASEFDRRAWRESYRYRKEPFPLVSPVLGTVAQPVVSFGGDLGVAWRVGEPGQLLVLGAVLSGERLYVEGSPLAPLAADDSLAQAALAGRYTERRRVRVHLLVGARHLRFTSHGGVDGVNAIEDIREGVEAGVVVGGSPLGAGGLQRDWFASVEGYYGAALDSRTLAFARGKWEGRYLRDPGRWDGVLASGELFMYNAVSARGMVVVGLSGAGGWHSSTPFQLLLGGSNGIRGYGYTGLPVGRRVVVQGEHRYFVGTAFGAVDVGTVAFVDIGRGWAGDAAFGENTGLVGAIGGGLRLAFPSGSRLTYRLDLAIPLSRGLGPEFRFGLHQQFGVLRGEPDDVARSRELISSVTVFNFPRF
jgi:hypothetical protein